MSSRPLRQCATPRCEALVQGGHCIEHGGRSREAQRKAELDRHRGSARERGYDRRWDRASEGYREHNPLCDHCELEGGLLHAASAVDHIQPHRGDRLLLWDAGNWQGLCAEHRGRKDAREQGLIPCPHDAAYVRRVQGNDVCAQCGVVARTGGPGNLYNPTSWDRAGSLAHARTELENSAAGPGEG